MSSIKQKIETKLNNAKIYAHDNGKKAFIHKFLDKSFTLGVSYQKWYEINQVTKDELAKQSNTKFAYEPLISLIVPTFNTPVNYLMEMVDSVLKQSYSKWELCIADGSGNNDELHKILDGLAHKDSRIKIKILNENKGISGNTNEALELAAGDYIALYDHDDVLTPDALFEIVKSLQSKRHDILYTDEDKITENSNVHFEPSFKPDFNIDLLYSHNYITHLFVVSRKILDRVKGFNSKYDGAQDYDFILRCIENSSSIYHIPKILYHWRMHANSTAKNPESKMYCYDAGKNAIQDHLDRIGVNATVENMEQFGMYHVKYDVSSNPLVSVIIPNKDHIDDLDKCIKSLYNTNTYSNIEIIIVENNSVEDRTFEYYKNIQSSYENIKILTWNNEFNYAAINNFGVASAAADYILFLNNDTEIINGDSLFEMLGLCMREDVGIVGAKLLYADNTIQHAGVVLGFGPYGGFAGHVFSNMYADSYGYMNRPLLSTDYSAVTGACMMVKKELFIQVGGFSEEFKVSLNDIDLCLKIRDLNKLVVYNAHSLWHHYESKSRGSDEAPQKVERFKSEIKLFQDKWHKYFINGDPYYNINFDVKRGPFMLYKNY